MTPRSGSASCACGEPATRTSIASGKRLCLECGIRNANNAAREMHAKSGPAWEAWKAGGGADTLAVNRRSPRFAAARDANLEKARAANARRRAATAPVDATPPPPEPEPVPPPDPPRRVPQVLFRAPW